MPRFNPRDITSSYASISALNANFDDIAEVLDKAVVLDGEPVVVESDFDMNHYKIRNLSAPAAAGDALRLGDLEDLIPETALSALLQTEGGAAYVGAEDPGPGSIWTNVQGHINHLFSSAGAAVVGTIQAGTGAVKRFITSKLGDVLHVKDYGAVCDGVTDDTVACQNAIDAGVAQGKTVLFPSTIKHGALTRPSGSHIMGPGMKCTVTLPSGTYTTQTFTGSNTKTEGFRYMAAGKTAGYEIDINCGTNILNHNHFEAIETFSAKGGIKDTGSGGGYHANTKLKNVQFRAHEGPGLLWVRAFGFLEIAWTVVDYVNVSNSAFTGFEVDFAALPAGAGGLEFRQCDVGGSAGVYNHAAQVGFKIKNGSSIWLNKTRADSLGGKGYEITNCSKIDFDAEAGLCAGTGADLIGVSSASGVIHVYGRKGLGYAPATVDGIKLSGICYGVNLVGGIVRDNTGHGINKSTMTAGSSVITFRNYHSTDNTLRGLKTTGNVGVLSFGGVLVNNLGGNYDLGGNLDYIVPGTILSSGVPSGNIGPGPVTG